MKRRVFAILLASVLCIGFIPDSVHAETEETAGAAKGETIDEINETEPESENIDVVSVSDGIESDKSSEEPVDIDLENVDKKVQSIPDITVDNDQTEPSLCYEDLYSSMEVLLDQALAMEESAGAENLWNELMDLWEQIYAAEKEGTSGLSEEERAALDDLTDQIYKRLAELGYDPYALVTLDAIDSFENLVKAVNEAEGSVEITLASDISHEDTGTGELVTVPDGADVTIDLNGYTISAIDHASSALFTIPDGAALTIRDSQAAPAEKGSGEKVSASEAGKIATVGESSDGKISLTYYVTESEVTNSLTGATAETRYEYQATSAGMIRGNGETHDLFTVSGGTLNIKSGFIYGGNAGTIYRGIDADSGTVNISGGFICGFNEAYASNHGEDSDGGAIRVTGSAVLNLSGDAVIAGNRAATGGALDLANGAVLNMNGGVISGNEATEDAATSEWNNDFGGGGIHAYGRATVVNISGGYLTNNLADCTGYFDGGGGILLDGARLNFSHGYITGNKASSGGGIRTAFAAMSGQMSSTVYITGGYLCANYATGAEGGGLNLDNGGYGEIHAETPIYINNNETNTSVHWGGGGVYVANGSTLYIDDSLITENAAGGFGGGVAGCSTGRIAVADDAGSAIYHNTAEGQHTSGDGSTKHDDTEYALNDKVFMENGYADYYCALESVVSGMMLGGGSANWHGSADGVVVDDVAITEFVWASYIMGLTANPDEEAVAAAQNAAKVYITGNSSYTHGGGVLSNGYLFLGTVIDYEIGDALQILADKQLIDQDGGTKNIEEDQFTFEITDEKEEVVSIGTTQSDGSIFFDRRLPFNEEGTYLYCIRETASKDPTVTMDPAVYTLVVTVDKDEREVTAAGVPLDYIYYHITHITLTKSDAAEPLIDRDVTSSPDSVETVTIPSPAFVNYAKDKTSMTVEKTWQDEAGSEIVWPEEIDSITVYLYQDGEIYGDPGTLTRENPGYTWTDLPTSGTDGSGETIYYTYEVTEDYIPGYLPSYEITDPENEIITNQPVKPEITKEIAEDDYDRKEESGEDMHEGEDVYGDGWGEWDDADNHQEVTYQLILTDISHAANLIVHDYLEEGLDFEPDTVVIDLYDGGTDTLLEEGVDYTEHEGTCSDPNGCAMDGCTFEVTFEDNVFADISEDAYMVISYKALTDTHEEDYDDYEDEILNHSYMTYGINSYRSSIVTTATDLFGFGVYKYADGGEGETALAGAEFILERNGVYAVFETETDSDTGDVYYMVDSWTDDTGSAGTLISGSDGMIRIEGLDDDTYTITETKAPAGYEIVDETITITIDEDGNVTVDGDTGSKEVLVGHVVNVENALILIDIGGAKTWNDADNQDGKRPSEITIHLLADGTEIDSKAVTAEDGWVWNFTDLPQNKDGKEILYTITEDEVEGYTTEVNGYDVINTYTPEPEEETRDISGFKDWVDDNDKADARPDSVTVNLYQNDQLYESRTVTSDDDWAWSWIGLPKYDEDGKEYFYTIDEDEVEDYTPTYYEGNFNITNTFTAEEEDEKPTSGLKKGGDIPKTGDLNHISLWLALFAAAAAGLLITFRLKKRG